MRWASAISGAADLERAAHEVVEEVCFRLKSSSPHLAVVFSSEHHRGSFEQLAKWISAPLGAPLLLGCSASGVIGDGREVQERAGLSLTVAHLPDVDLAVRHLTLADLPRLGAEREEWDELSSSLGRDVSSFVMLADPFSFDTERFLRGIDSVHPATPMVGGLASGSQRPGETALFERQRCLKEGALVLSLAGDVVLDTIVAQGCRPIGEPMAITKCKRHLLHELNGEPVLLSLKRLFDSLETDDQELFRESLFVGLASEESSDGASPDEFLIRNVLGIRSRDKALAVGARLRKEQIVQFHVRDAISSAEEVDRLLSGFAEREEARAAKGALLFSCLGRGMQMYGEPDHDTDLFRERLGGVPLGGFFCNGEIGPVEGATSLLGYTSSFGIFRPAMPDSAE